MWDEYSDKTTEIRCNMTGWAGDLQSLVPYVLNDLTRKNMTLNYNNIYKRVQECLANPDPSSSTFSESDLLADIDASNLYERLVNMTTDSYKKYFSTYYKVDYQERFRLFTGTRTYQEIYDCVEGYLRYTAVGDVSNLNDEQRRAFATAFVDYVWNYAVERS